MNRRCKEVVKVCYRRPSSCLYCLHERNEFKVDLCTENCLQHLKAIPAVRRCNKTGVVTRYSRTGNIRLREEHDCLTNEIRRARDPKPC